MPTPAVLLTKRLIDISAALTGLALTLPLYPAIALAVRFDSPGPVFYRQRRAKTLLRSDGGVPECEHFWILKFRSMPTDAEKTTGAVLASARDPRTTRIGRFLRRTRLDELPQFINILKGDMSLVGPRPERPELLDDLALAIPFFEERMRGLKPGLTGLAQVALGYTGSLPEGSELAKFRHTLENPYQLQEAAGALADSMRIKLLYDLAYSASLERFSSFLHTELSIIFRTPWVMLRGSPH